jgi:hypothetical protein
MAHSTNAMVGLVDGSRLPLAWLTDAGLTPVESFERRLVVSAIEKRKEKPGLDQQGGVQQKQRKRSRYRIRLLDRD